MRTRSSNIKYAFSTKMRKTRRYGFCVNKKEKLNIVLYFDFIIIYLLYLLGLVFIIFCPPLFSSKFSNFSQTFVVNRGDDSSLPVFSIYCTLSTVY